MAGETFAEAAAVLARLNASGLSTNTTLLGEDVLSVDEARSVTAEYVQIMDGIAERGLRTNVSLKLTHLGLLLDEELAYENVKHWSTTPRGSARSSVSTWSTRRSSTRRSASTGASARGQRGRGHGAAGVPYRTPGDLESLLSLDPRPNLRLVEAAYSSGRRSPTAKADVDGPTRA